MHNCHICTEMKVYKQNLLVSGGTSYVSGYISWLCSSFCLGASLEHKLFQINVGKKLWTQHFSAKQHKSVLSSLEDCVVTSPACLRIHGNSVLLNSCTCGTQYKTLAKSSTRRFLCVAYQLLQLSWTNSNSGEKPAASSINRDRYAKEKKRLQFVLGKLALMSLYL